MDNSAAKSLKMGNMPVGKLLFVMSGPAILSMLVQSLYNVVDSIFVAKVSGSATAALSLAFPMQMLIMAFAFGIGVGSNSAISRKLGEGKPEEASKTAQTGIILSLIVAAFFAIFGYFISKLFVSAYINTGDYENSALVMKYGVEYLSIVVCASFGMYIEIFASRVLQATGNMTIPMCSQLIGAITNIILDPILIFGYLGFPRMEVMGAAIATVIGQIAAMTFSLIMLKKQTQDIHVFPHKGFRLQKQYVTEILKVGIPVTILNSVSSVTVAALNAILNVFGDVAISVLGIYFKLQSFVFMPVFGLCQGALPIMGYNFGANRKDRFNKVFRLSIIVACVIMVLGLLIFQLLPEQLLSLFKPDEATDGSDYYARLVETGTVAFRIISISFIPAAFCIVMINMFQSLGKGVVSMLMSLFRQIIILLPAAKILTDIYGLNATWWSYPVGEIVTILVFLPYSIICINKMFSSITNRETARTQAEENTLSGGAAVQAQVFEDFGSESESKTDEVAKNASPAQSETAGTESDKEDNRD